VTRIEKVTRVLVPFRESADPLVLPESIETVPPSRQKLVGITLVTHIPDQLIGREIKDMVKGDGEFNHTEIGSEMSSPLGNRLKDDLSYLVAELLELQEGERLDIRGIPDPVQDVFHR
jgi:hypothetical protein